MGRGDGSIEPVKLKALMGRALKVKDEIGEINADFNADKKEAIDKHGLHGRAFNLCVTVARMEQVKRLAFLNAFDSYRDILKLDDAPQGELPGTSNVTTLRAGT